MAKLETDIDKLSDANIDDKLYGSQDLPLGRLYNESTRLMAQYIIGGRMGTEADIEFGSEYLRVDSKNARHIVNDGVTDRVVIGFFED